MATRRGDTKIELDLIRRPGGNFANEGQMAAAIGSCFGRKLPDNILETMANTPRSRFVGMNGDAMFDPFISIPLPSENGLANITTPSSIVAFCFSMLDLQEKDRILEIGTGSGYPAMIAAQVGGNSIITLESDRAVFDKGVKVIGGSRLRAGEKVNPLNIAYSGRMDGENPWKKLVAFQGDTFEKIVIWAVAAERQIYAAKSMLAKNGTLVYFTLSGVHGRKGELVEAHPAVFTRKTYEGQKTKEALERWKNISPEIEERMAEKGIYRPPEKTITEELTVIYERIAFLSTGLKSE